MWVISFPALALVIGWLYERAQSSVFVLALFHTSLNMATATKGTNGLIASLVSAVVLVWALALLRRQRSTLTTRRRDAGRTRAEEAGRTMVRTTPDGARSSARIKAPSA
jgi:heme O synthase-like polyprenyltransferase